MQPEQTTLPAVDFPALAPLERRNRREPDFRGFFTFEEPMQPEQTTLPPEDFPALAVLARTGTTREFAAAASR